MAVLWTCCTDAARKPCAACSAIMYRPWVNLAVSVTTRDSHMPEAAMVDAPRAVQDSLAKTHASLFILKKRNRLSN
jgi:hypothetical protein